MAANSAKEERIQFLQRLDGSRETDGHNDVDNKVRSQNEEADMPYRKNWALQMYDRKQQTR